MWEVNGRLFAMAIKEFLKPLFDSVPPNVRRLAAGGIVLGVLLMLFLKVFDDVFAFPESALTWVGAGVTVLFALLLCWNAGTFAEKCLHFGAGYVIIFAIGLASNNVIADIRGNIGVITDPPPEVLSFDDLMLPEN